MTERQEQQAWRIHYALGSNGMVMAFAEPDLIPGRPPTLRHDHPLAKIGVTWDFEPFYETQRPARMVEETDEFTDGQINAAIDAWVQHTNWRDPDCERTAKILREQMRAAFKAAGARPS